MRFNDGPTLAEIGATRALVVRDHQLAAGMVGDVDGLLDRFVHRLEVVARVGDIRSAEACRRRGQRLDLFGRGVDGWRIVETGAEAEGAVGDRLRHGVLHQRCLRFVRGAVGDRHDALAQGRVADEQGGVGGDAALFQFGDIVGEAVEAEILLAADQGEGWRRWTVQQQGGKADPAIAGDHRRHALADLRVHAVRRQQCAVIMRVHIDEARRHDLARGIDLLHAARVAKPADGGDPVAGNGDVGLETLRTVA